MADRKPHEQRKIKKTYLLNRKTDRRYRLNGIKDAGRPPAKGSLHKDFSDHVKYRPADLPPRVDLRRWMTAVEDQSDINSCTANAIAGAYEYLVNKATDTHIDISRLFIYYNSRAKDIEENGGNEKVTDDGSAISYAIETMEELGVCLESKWPYNTKKVNKKPSKESYEAAKDYTITEALEVDLDLHEIKSCLAQGFPIVIITELYASFDEAESKGVVPMPSKKEAARSSHGSHALLLSGYSDASKRFIVRNSWGDDWGDKGYCYMPYAYIVNPELTQPGWTIKKLAVEDMGEDTWDNEDEAEYQSDEDNDNDSEEDDEDDAAIEDVDEDDEDDEDDDE